MNNQKISNAVAEFLSKGGQIKHLPPQKEKKTYQKVRSHSPRIENTSYRKMIMRNSFEENQND